MSYAIANIIYGIPLNHAIRQRVRAWVNGDEDGPWPARLDINDIDEDDSDTWGGEAVWTTLYSGCDRYAPGFCGVLLEEINAVGEPISLDARQLPSPTEAQKAEALRRIDLMDPDLRAVADPVGLYLVWSTS